MRNILLQIKNIIFLHIKAGENLIKHDGVEHAGYMAFITLLSFFPFLIFLIAATSLIGKSDQGRELVTLILNIMPADLIKALYPRIQEILSSPPTSFLTISILGVVWTSSTTVEGVRTILNKVYHEATPPAYILRRFMSIIQFLFFSAILLVSLFFFIFIPEIFNTISQFHHLTPILGALNHIFGKFSGPLLDNFRLFTFALTLFFCVIFLYYLIPNVKLSFRSLIPGAIEVVLLWLLSGSLLSDYLYIFTQINVVYGSLAGMIICLLFFYIIHLIFIYGAELNSLLLERKKIN